MPLNQYGDHATFIARDYHDVAGDLTIVNAYPGSLAEDAKQLLDNVEVKRVMGSITSSLSLQIAKRYTYVDQGKTGCVPTTRVAIIEEILEWTTNTRAESPNLFWLTGVPGSGKSSITTSITKILRDRKSNIIIIQLFISRSHESTTNPNFIFPTIAMQLAAQDHAVALQINEALDALPTLTDGISDLQATKLFVEPIRTLAELYFQKSVVVVLDALDESTTIVGRTVADILSTAVNDLPSNAKVFVSSRSEAAIQKVFSRLVNLGHAAHIHLETSDVSSLQDVSGFLSGEITSIVDDNYLDEDWPGEERLRALCDNASGLFIWAVTATKFIRSRITSEGTECLDDVLEDLGSEGMEDIDTLYSTIIDKVLAKEKDSWPFERFRRIVGCIIALKEPLAIADLQVLLGLRKPGGKRPVDTKQFFRQFRTLLVNGNEDINDGTVHSLHKSFVDFITQRSHNRYRVDVQASSHELASRSLFQLQSLSRDMCHIGQMGKLNVDIQDLDSRINKNISIPVRYACRFWSAHLSNTHPAPQENDALADVFRVFFFQKLLNWMEVMSLVEAQSIFTLLNNASRWAKVEYASDPELTTLIRDSLRFVQMFGALIGESASQIYISAIPFTPRESVLYRIYSSTCYGSIKLLTGAADHWPDLLWESSGHTDTIYALAYSPDGKQIASGSSDWTIRVWDSMTGQQVRPPLTGHNGTVTSLAFTPDSKKIVSGSEDNTIRIWDVADGHLTDLSLEEHTHPITALAISPDGLHILAGSYYGAVKLWDTRSGQIVATLHARRKDEEEVYSVAFAALGDKIMSTTREPIIRIWDFRSRTLIATIKLEDIAPTDSLEAWAYLYSDDYVPQIRPSVTFSPDGANIIVANSENVKTWNSGNWKLIAPFSVTASTSLIQRAALSTAGERVALIRDDSSISFWEVSTGRLIGSPRTRHTTTIVPPVFSPDGAQAASASVYQSVCVWDVVSPQHSNASTGERDAIHSAAFSADGKRIVASSRQAIHIYESAAGERVGSYPINRNVAKRNPDTITLSSDGKMYASSASNSLELYSVTSGELIRTHLMEDGIRSVAFSPDAAKVACVSVDGTIHIWFTASGDPVTPPLTRPSGTASVIFTPDGNKVVGETFMRPRDAHMVIWDIQSGQQSEVVLKEPGVPICLSPDGQQIVMRMLNPTTPETFIVDAFDRHVMHPDRWCEEISTFFPVIEPEGWVRSSFDGRLLYFLPPGQVDCHAPRCVYQGSKLTTRSGIHSDSYSIIVDATDTLQYFGISTSN